MPRRTKQTKKTQNGNQRQVAGVPDTPNIINASNLNDTATDLDNGNLTTQEIDFRDRGIGGAIKFKRRNGHNCLSKDCAKTHKFSPQCITKEHEGWCPGCKHLVSGRYGCKNCHIKRPHLFFDTNIFTRWLMMKELREAAAAAAATTAAAATQNNQGNANAQDATRNNQGNASANNGRKWWLWK